eukprot:CAMPEP_0182426812 /NCGR_PEP_ID=MMETSP1167-20130531/13327_1 /TAXON_ID=2988 /ORGANISM="Mallomonas Sp, Strain CCMP3275" /LENGTH=378 /DNA_ID=CAMNT_0024608515 /DNA_START=341 /DNA_END=1477 /DNA_ORIENTATION=+
MNRPMNISRSLPGKRHIHSLMPPLLLPISQSSVSFNISAEEQAAVSRVLSQICRGVAEGSMFRNFVRLHLHDMRRATQTLRLIPPDPSVTGADTEGAPRLMAVIIESRTMIELEYCIRNVMHYLSIPDDTGVVMKWQLQVHYLSGIYGNEQYLRAMLEPLGHVSMVPLPFEVNSPVSYNRLLLSESFWSGLSEVADKVLIFQTDSMLLRSGMNKFIKYEYLGAPWRLDLPFVVQKGVVNGIGNGGFTFRDVKLMLSVLWTKEKFMFSEDVEFAKRAEKLCENFPTRAVAYSFAVESPCPDIPLAIDFKNGSSTKMRPIDLNMLSAMPSYTTSTINSLVLPYNESLPLFIPIGIHQVWMYFNYTEALDLIKLSLPGANE